MDVLGLVKAHLLQQLGNPLEALVGPGLSSESIEASNTELKSSSK